MYTVSATEQPQVSKVSK